jgi:hypothetical protein
VLFGQRRACGHGLNTCSTLLGSVILVLKRVALFRRNLLLVEGDSYGRFVIEMWIPDIRRISSSWRP